MNGSTRVMVLAGLLCGLLAAGPAAADGGRITFSGAVVVPTCTIREPSIATAATDSHAFVTRRLTCGGHLPVTSGSADAASYGLSVVSLNGAQAEGNPLLEYFTGYLASDHVADATMVTRTYE